MFEGYGGNNDGILKKWSVFVAIMRKRCDRMLYNIYKVYYDIA